MSKYSIVYNYSYILSNFKGPIFTLRNLTHASLKMMLNVDRINF